MKTRTEERAYEDGLELVTITQGMNGYPSGLYKAVADFESFEDAECFADEVNGEVVLLSRRDGHQFWVNHGRQYEPLERAKYLDEDEDVVFTDEGEFESWCVGEIDHYMDGGLNLYDLRSMLDTMVDTYEEIMQRREDEVVVVDKRDFTAVSLHKYVTRVHDDDVTTYMLAVVDHETDEDEIEEEDED